ncbi:hypothetical protein QYR00_24790 (plasmid) [Agrobacterium tumefaciens]|nr:hypothetical protein QYR00_24790 [Agrobacterium tumefaciens]
MMMALVTSILPGVRLLGGSRQTVYYPLMRYLVGTSLDAENDRALLVSMRHDRRTGMWGHRVLKPASAFPLLETEYAEHGLAVAAAYGEQTLEEAAGDLSFFTCDPIWTKMCRHLENGEITARSPQWEWA